MRRLDLDILGPTRARALLRGTASVIRLLRGDCRETLPTLEAASVQAVITSPPYYGLRDYGLPALVWGQTCCDHPHEWGAAERGPWANELPSAKSETKRNNAHHESMGKTAGQFCQHVHDWGEPSIAHAAGYEVGEKARWNHRKNGRGEAQERILAKEPGWTRKDVVQGHACACGAWLGSLGLEPTPDLYIEHLVEVFRQVRRVLKDDGVLWLNLGDSYAGSGKGPSNSLNRSNPHSHEAAESMKRGLNNLRDTPTSWMPMQRIGPQEHTIGHGRVPGLKPKDLMMIPARAAIALQADGWTLRAMLPWLKKNCMPGSEKDRPTTAVEYWFLLTNRRRYYWDYKATRVEARRQGSGNKARLIASAGERSRTNSHLGSSVPWQDDGSGRNWRNSDLFFESWQGLLTDEDDDPLALVVNPRPLKLAHFATFPPKIVEPLIRASTRPGDTVLDCFGGAGTVGLVADRMERNAVLCDLKPDYADMSADRIVGDAPMFVELEAGA